MAWARDYFASASEACLARRRCEIAAAGLARREPGAHAPGPGDPTARAALAAVEARREMGRLDAAIGEALRVVDGVRALHPGQRWADALEARFVSPGGRRGYREVARLLGVSPSTAHADVDCALDVCDHDGMAALLCAGREARAAGLTFSRTRLV